jgi:hypothetical protein
MQITTKKTDNPCARSPGPVVETCGCGYRFGRRITAYRQNGVFWLLELDALPGFPIYDIDTECPICHSPWSFHMHRKSKRAHFE